MGRLNLSGVSVDKPEEAPPVPKDTLMIPTFQRILSRPAAADNDLSWLEAWSQRRDDVVKRVRGDVGVVIEGRFDHHAMRIEWGPSQRDYIRGRELRLRYELGLPAWLEMVVLSRELADELEARTFDDLTRDQQTGIDTAQMPEEARWLAMFERVPVEAMPAGLGERFVVLGARESFAQGWLDSEVSLRLTRACNRWLNPETPLVLMTLRGRVYLRTEAPALDEALLDGMRALGDTAAHQALRVAERPTQDIASTLFDIDEIL